MHPVPEPPEDGPDSSSIRAYEMRQRWLINGVFASLILLLYGFDYIILKHHSLATLLVRLSWGSSLLILTALRIRLGKRWDLPLLDIGVVIMSLCMLGLIELTGGPYSPYMSMVPSMPLILALIVPSTPRPAVLGGVLCGVGVLGMLLARGHGQHALAWAGVTASSTFFGVYGGSRMRKMQAAEQEARLERTRREALEKLAMAERHRAQTEKLATVGRLAASVMHEINNPLAFVRSNLEFLRTEVLAQGLAEPLHGELSEVFHETKEGVERIRQIVSDLKGFSHMDVEEPGECALADVVTDAARLATVRLKNVATLRVALPPGLPEVFVIRRRLAQVLLNLLVNAGDALEEARVEHAEVWVRGQLEAGRVTLLVEDNGPGFPPEVLPRLFEAFFTTKGPEQGTGLGLNLSRELVERFGGTLHAENRPEGGARLRLELPVHKRP